MVQIRMHIAASLLCPQQSPFMDNHALLLKTQNYFQHRTPGATTNYLELAPEVESSSSSGPDEK